MAVPQAPEPRTAMRLMRFSFGSEAGFRAGEQAADVLVMFDDDEEGDGELDGDEERRARCR